MTPSTVEAAALVDALLGLGVSDAVLSPGSRSAPLALVLAQAERFGRLRLHVRIDERSAGYLALGLAKRSGSPVPVVATSGTAVANVFPAVVEAAYAGVPLLVLSADRPHALRGVGAPQTIDQIKLFGDHVRLFADAAPSSGEPSQSRYWQSLVGRAVAAATDPRDPGPVHLNLPFDDPLVPAAGEESWPEPFSAPPPPRVLPPASADLPLENVLAAVGLDTVPERALVVAGDLGGAGWADAGRVAALAEACGWPLIAEPTAALHRAPTWVPAGPLVVGSETWLATHRPELVLSIGRVGLHRQTLGLIGAAPRHVAIDRTARWSDPTRSASAAVIGAVPTPPAGAAPPGSGPESRWLSAWREAGRRAARQVDKILDGEDMFTGLHVARHVWRTTADATLLFLAASWPIRQAQLTAAGGAGVQVMANRGANGIDGLVSTAWGAALAHETETGGATVALLGDLAFLHDGNGLLAGQGERRPSLTYVVTDNDGGGIFSQLEQADPRFGVDFERVFGTPHGLHLVGRSRLSGVPARGVDDLAGFVGAFEDRPHGVSVIVAQVADRAAEAEVLRTLRDGVAAALAD